MKSNTEKIGILKGVLGTTIVFSVGIGVGLFFLHRHYEEKMDKIERETVDYCLDFAAEHYERVLQKQKAEAASLSSCRGGYQPPEGEHSSQQDYPSSFAPLNHLP